MPTTRRFKQVYVTITVLFVLAAFGAAAAGVWVLALALLLMGGAMTGASRQMKAAPSSSSRPWRRNGPHRMS